MSHTILIVDDSKLARMAAIRALASRYPAWARLEAASGAEALLAMQHEPDVALIDFNMPEQDGLELVSELRSLNPTMPIAIISANSQQEIINRAQALSATFLSKPLSEVEFGEFLDQATKRLDQSSK